MHPKTVTSPETSCPTLSRQQGMIFNGLRIPAVDRRDWTLPRWVELRGTRFGIEPVLDLASPACAVTARHVVTCEREFVLRRGAVLDRIKEALVTAPSHVKPLLRKGSRLICKGRLAELGDDNVVRAHTRELVAAASALDDARTAYAAAFGAAAEHSATVLRAVARDTRFREAVAWQNSRALHTAVNALARTETAARNPQHRQWTALVTSYLQRFTTTNDTIGFFGPVEWARPGDHPRGLELRADLGLVADRTVHLEHWAVHEFARALSTPDTLAWAVPRRLPVGTVDGDRPLEPPQPSAGLPGDDDTVLRAVDGVRTARELRGLLPQVDVLGVLTRLRDERRITWAFEVSPAAPVPEHALREQLARISEPRPREAALGALDELIAGRQAVAAAAGDPDRVADAMAKLGEVFTRHTGTASVRRPGKGRVSRTLVYEQCRRDLAVAVGADLVASLMTPLSLVLASANWFTAAGAALGQRALLDTFRAAETGGTTMRLTDFWSRANGLVHPLEGGVVERLTSALRDRWANILRLDLDRPAVSFRADTLRDKVRAAFGAPPPGTCGAARHSVDVLIAARNAAAVRAGDFQWVLGELHAGTPPADGAAQGRLADALLQPGADRAGSTLVADLLLSEVDGSLVAHDHTGDTRVDLGALVSEQLARHFQPLPPAPHTPRVSIDDLVVSRENWRLPATALAFAFAGDEPTRFLRAQEWRHTTGVPRFVFVRSAVEDKPFYVDLECLPSVEHFANAIRTLDREQPTEPMSVSEMLPGPDQLWLTDAHGAKYTAEFRFVAVDCRGPAKDGQP